MLTLFAAPKPFVGHAGLIQRNAIRSWTLLDPACEIILFGDEPGIGETAREFGLRHVPDPKTNHFGLPVVNDLFDRAERLATNDLLCYVNADIILPPNFAKTTYSVASECGDYLMIGRRIDIDIADPVNFSGDWYGRLNTFAEHRGRLHDRTGIDYFAFRRGMLGGYMPPFSVGRVMWDNWTIYWARLRSIPVIDATQAVRCFHQNHDYAHAKAPAGGNDDVFGEARMESPQQNWNKLLGFHEMFAYHIGDASHCLLDDRLVPAAYVGTRSRAPSRQQLPFENLTWLPAPDVISRQILYNQFENNEIAFVRRFLRPGMTVVDIGAHHGLYSLLASVLVGATGRVIAVEPSPREMVRLQMHLAINRISNIEAIATAVASRTGRDLLQVYLTSESGRSALRTAPSSDPRTFVPVDTRDLDGILAERNCGPVDLLKIDTAGSEYDVLEGARGVLGSGRRPVILCDMDEVTARPFGVSRTTLRLRVEESGYSWFMACPDGQLAPFPDDGPFNGPLVAVPDERMAEVDLHGSRGLPL